MKTTSKKMSLLNSKGIKEIAQGDILALNQDIFIVTKLRESDYINESLFNDYRPRRLHIQAKEEAKYNLISISSGTRFFDYDLELTELLVKVSQSKFRVVKHIEFKELD